VAAHRAIGAVLLARRRHLGHVAVDAAGLLDLVDARQAVAGVRRAAPERRLVDAREVDRHVDVGRQEAAVAADAQLVAERLDGHRVAVLLD
jgi:hypothetical protein